MTGSGCAMSLACRRTAVWRRTSLPWRPHCPGGVDGGALRPHARSKTAPVQVLLLRGPILVETPPRHRPRRGQPQRARYTLHRHQSRGRPRQASLREALFRARPGREPHQGLESPPRIRPDLMLEGERQPDATDAARMRLLDLVETPGRLSKAVPLATCPVRHAAAASRQAGRHHRREEDPDHRHTAGILSAKGAAALPLRRPRTTKNSLTQAPRQTRNINPYDPRQDTGRTANRTPTSDAREKPTARRTNCPSRKLQRHELLRLSQMT